MRIRFAGGILIEFRMSFVYSVIFWWHKMNFESIFGQSKYQMFITKIVNDYMEFVLFMQSRNQIIFFYWSHFHWNYLMNKWLKLSYEQMTNTDVLEDHITYSINDTISLNARLVGFNSRIWYACRSRYSSSICFSKNLFISSPYFKMLLLEWKRPANKVKRFWSMKNLKN